MIVPRHHLTPTTKGNEEMKEYIVTISINYGTNIEAESEEEALKKARVYLGEMDANTLADIADITIEDEGAGQ